MHLTGFSPNSDLDHISLLGIWNLDSEVLELSVVSGSSWCRTRTGGENRTDSLLSQRGESHMNQKGDGGRSSPVLLLSCFHKTWVNFVFCLWIQKNLFLYNTLLIFTWESLMWVLLFCDPTLLTIGPPLGGNAGQTASLAECSPGDHPAGTPSSWVSFPRCHSICPPGSSLRAQPWKN